MNTFFAIGVVLLQITAGILIWIALLGSVLRSAILALGIGTALGTFLSMIISVLAHGTTLSTYAWILPTAFALLVVVIRWDSFRSNARQLSASRPEVLGVLVTLVVALPLVVIGWIRTPLNAIEKGASVDMYFFEALSQGIANFGPSNSILMTEGSLRYHWFAYAWSGELTAASGLGNFVALTRILPLVTLLGATLLAVGWAASLNFGKWKSPTWVPALAGLLVTVGGYTGALYGGILNFDSPSQSLSTVWLLGLIVVFALHVTPGQTNYGAVQHAIFLVLISLLTIATVGGKASSTAVALAGMALTGTLGLVLHKQWWRRAVVATLIVLVTSFVTYLLILSGVSINENLTEAASVRASTWQQLDPLIGIWGPLFGTLGLTLAVIARFGGFMWLGAHREYRTQPAVAVTAGAVLAGIVALFALRGGINDLWFVLAASAPAAVVSAFGVGQAAQWLQHTTKFRWNRWPILMSLGISIIAGLVSMVLSMNWSSASGSQTDSIFAWPGILFWLSAVSPWIVIPILALIAARFAGQKILGRNGIKIVIAISAISLTLTSIITRPAVLWTQSRQLVTDIGVVTPEGAAPTSVQANEVTPTATPTLADHQVAAAEWLKSNSQSTDIVGTSAPFTAQIPALTGRQMYLAGAQYQRGLGDSTQVDQVDRRAKISEGLLTDEWAVAAREMCDQGVDLVWIEGSSPMSQLYIATKIIGRISIFQTTTFCSDL